jgi:hypothetical protein
MIESAPGKILYSDTNTHSVYAVSLDNAPKVDFRKSDIKTLYVDLGISGRRIATILGVCPATPYNRLKAMGVVIKPSFIDSEIEQKRIDGIKRAWIERREIRLAKIHNPESDAKRKASGSRTYSQDQMVREKNLANITAAREVFKRNAYLTGQKKALEKADRYIAKARGILESPRFSLLSFHQQDLLRYRYQLDGNRPKSLEEVGQYCGKVTKQRAGQIEQSALRILFNEPKIGSAG